jgi:hypothetical protein
MSMKRGQIAHLDRNAANADASNLAFLCLDHHDQYDSKTRQSKNFMVDEVRAYRDELYADIDVYFGLGGGVIGRAWLWLLDRTSRRLR